MMSLPNVPTATSFRVAVLKVLRTKHCISNSVQIFFTTLPPSKSPTIHELLSALALELKANMSSSARNGQSTLLPVPDIGGDTRLTCTATHFEPRQLSPGPTPQSLLDPPPVTGFCRDGYCPTSHAAPSATSWQASSATNSSPSRRRRATTCASCPACGPAAGGACAPAAGSTPCGPSRRAGSRGPACPGSTSRRPRRRPWRASTWRGFGALLSSRGSSRH